MTNQVKPHYTRKNPYGLGGPGIEYESKDLPSKEGFKKELIGKQVKRESKKGRLAIREARQVAASAVFPRVRRPGPSPERSAASQRIAGIAGAQRYLAKTASKHAPKPGTLRHAMQGLGKASKFIGKGIGGAAALVAGESLASKAGVSAKVAEDAGWGGLAAGLKSAGKGAARRAGVAGIAIGLAASLSKASKELGKRHGEAGAHAQLSKLGAGEYTKAKDWKGIRRAAFRSGIAKPGGKSMSLDEAGSIIKSHRRN